MFRLFLLLLISLEQFAFAHQACLIPVREIEKGELVTEDDFTYAREQNKQCLTSIEFNKPIKARKKLSPEKIIRKGDLFLDSSIIHKGEIVTVKFIRNNLSIETKGSALQNGKAGDVIKIRNLNTNKILLGKVLEDGSLVIQSN